MPTCYTTFLDRFLTTVPVSQLDEADAFVREVRLMCTEFMNKSPVLLYKPFSRAARATTFFSAKNRHRSSNADGIIFNEAIQAAGAFERGLDIVTTNDAPDTCVIILPDSFQLTYSNISLTQFKESAGLIDDPADLGALVFNNDVSQLTENAKHVIATKVPFYYCIRIN